MAEPIHPHHRARRIDLDVGLNPHLKRVNHLNLMIDMLNEVAEGRWRKGAANTPEASLVDTPTCQITFDLREWHHKDECGTPACAIGHACMDKRFNDLGLVALGFSPHFGGAGSWNALEEFFGIPEVDLWFLFAEDEYPPEATPHLVAQRIELYLRRLKAVVDRA